MRPQRISGYTLIEMLAAISIITILVSLAPPMLNILEKNRQQSELFELQRLLQLARSNAVSSGNVTTLCGSADGINCESDWLSPTILVFEDTDNNHQLNSQDKTIQQVSFSKGKWHWRGSNRQYLRFRADGTPIEWGRFTLCTQSGEINTAPQLVLNVVGRVYSTATPIQQLNDNGLCI